MNRYLGKLRLALAFIITTVFLLQACANFSKDNGLSTLDAQREEFTKAANSRIIEEAPGVTINKIRETDGNILVAVDYPSYDANEQISSVIESYIAGVVEEFKAEAQSMGEPTQETGLFTLNIIYKPYETEDGIIGFKFIEDMYSGKTELDNFVSTFNFKKSDGSQVDINYFFNPSTGYLNTIADTVRDYLKRDYDFGDNKNEELFKEGTAPNVQNYSNFVRAPGHKFIFYFNAGEIAEREAGMIQAVIPMAEFKNVLNAELKEIYSPTPLPSQIPAPSAEPSQTSEASFAPLESVTAG